MRYIASILLVLTVTTAIQADPDRPQFGIIDWFPFGWVHDAQNQGMMVDIVHAINKTLGSNAEVVVAPVPRVLRGVAEADFDFTVTYRDTGMLNSVDYLADIGCLKSSVVAMKPISIQSINDLNGLKVAYPGGGYFVKRFLPSLDIDGVEVAQNYTMFKMALRGRLDAFVINDAVWFGYRADMYPHFKVPPESWQDFSEPYYMETLPIAVSVSKKSNQLALSEKIRIIMDDAEFVEELNRIYQKYKLPNAMHCLPQFAQ